MFRMLVFWTQLFGKRLYCIVLPCVELYLTQLYLLYRTKWNSYKWKRLNNYLPHITQQIPGYPLSKHTKTYPLPAFSNLSKQNTANQQFHNLNFSPQAFSHNKTLLIEKHSQITILWKQAPDPKSSRIGLGNN